MAQLRSFEDPGLLSLLPDPADPETFKKCKIDQVERKVHVQARLLHRDLLRLRREDAVFSAQRSDWMHGAVVAPQVLVLRFMGKERGDRLIMVNLGLDHYLVPAPKPLLAPPLDSHWGPLWSSEEVEYGGSGTPAIETEGKWLSPGHATLVFAPKKTVRLG